MFQTRSEETGIARFHSMKEAVEYAKDNPDVWKISFGIRSTKERIRLVRFPPDLNTWVYAPITDILDDLYRKHENGQLPAPLPDQRVPETEVLEALDRIFDQEEHDDLY